MSLIHLSTELRQELKLTPQLLQSMELLQMNSQELEQMADQMPFDIRGKKRRLGFKLLHAVFPEHALARIIGFFHVFRWKSFRNRQKPDGICGTRCLPHLVCNGFPDFRKIARDCGHVQILHSPSSITRRPSMQTDGLRMTQSM